MSATSSNSRLLLKLLAALALAIAAVVVLIVALRPVATVAPVVAGEAIDAKPGSVTVVEEYSQELRAEISGRVLRQDFNLDPGKHVKQDEVLAQLDPGDIQLEMDQIKIDYAAAKAGFEADHSTQLKIDSAAADLANFERLNKLGVYPDKDLTDRRRDMQALKQALDLEKIDHQKILDTYANEIKIDGRKLEKMTIRSPLDGIVSEVYAHPGDLIALDAPVATLITTNKVVEGKISEEDFAQISDGEAAKVTFLPYGDTEFDGKVSKILPTSDPETQRHLVFLDVKMDAAHSLSPGINGEVIIIVGRRHADTVVPRRAVFDLDGRNVYVVKDGRVELRKVTTGYLWSRGAEILSGLAPGEDVIVDELESFRPGDRVRVNEVPSDVAKK